MSVPVALPATQNTVAAMPAINSINHFDHYHPAPGTICALAYPGRKFSYV